MTDDVNVAPDPDPDTTADPSGESVGDITDEMLPEDLRPSEDNPLAQDPDPDAEPVEDLLEPGDGAVTSDEELAEAVAAESAERTDEPVDESSDES